MSILRNAAAVVVACSFLSMPDATSANAGAAAGPQEAAYSDPQAYCRAVRTVDQPGGSYRGPETPPWIESSVASRHSYSVAWRCVDGAVLACATEHSLSCMKAPWRDPEFWNRVLQSPEVRAECRATPSTDTVGGTHGQVGCVGGRPSLNRNNRSLDPQGFYRDEWSAVSPPYSAPASAAAMAPDARPLTTPGRGNGNDPAVELGNSLARLAGSALNSLFGPRATRPNPEAATPASPSAISGETASSEGFGFPLGERNAVSPLTVVPTIRQGDDSFYAAQGVGSINSGMCNALDRQARYHLAEDWNRDDEQEEGQAVYAAADGRVVHSADAGPGWLGVIIVQTLLPGSSRPGDYVTVLYGHLQGRLVQLGDEVHRGQRIASIGDYGSGGADHLHLEIRSSAVRLGLGERWCGYTRYADPFSRGWVTPSEFIRANTGAQTAIPPSS